jgi:hypothetical protein
MWETSSPGDKFTGDFGNEPDATSISDRGLFGPLAGNLSPGVFRLLQQNLPQPDHIGSLNLTEGVPLALTFSSVTLSHRGVKYAMCSVARDAVLGPEEST